MFLGNCQEIIGVTKMAMVLAMNDGCGHDGVDVRGGSNGRDDCGDAGPGDKVNYDSDHRGDDDEHHDS